MLPGSSGISKQVKQYVMNAFGWSGTDCMFDFELLELGTLNSSKDIWMHLISQNNTFFKIIEPKLEFDELEKYLDVPSSGCDVTLQFFSGQSIQAHRIVLASRSKYFRDLFTSAPTPPSVIPVQENYELFACLVCPTNYCSCFMITDFWLAALFVFRRSRCSPHQRII